MAAAAVAVTGIAVPAAVAPRPYFMTTVDVSSQRKTPPCTSLLAEVDLDEHVHLVSSTVRSRDSCSISQNKLHHLLLRASVLMTSLRNHRRARLSNQISSSIKVTRLPLSVGHQNKDKHEDIPCDLTTDEIPNYDILNTNHNILSPNKLCAAPPPSYDEAFSDIPPDYNDTNASAVADYKRVIPPLGDSRRPPPPPYERCAASTHQFVSSALNITPCLNPFLPGQKIDVSILAAEELYRTRGKKKKSKQGNQPDWFDNNEGNGNENNNENNPGDGNGDGQNDGGGDATGGDGDGGDGGKGGGGGDDDDGFTAAGNKKNKKNKKKNKKNEADEEEDGNKDTLADETQQDSAVVADSIWSDPSKMAEADPVDEWATFEPVGGSKKKNGKKNAKKLANAFDTISESPAGGDGGTKNDSNFDEINLDDNVPHINLNFGSNDNSTSNFDIGAIGSDWASKPADAWGTTKTGGSTWDFGALNGENGLGNKEDPLTDPAANNNIWQTGGTKKSNKNKNPFSNDINNTFDFGFGNVANSQPVDADYNDNQDPLNEDTGFTAAPSKGKKKGKKGGITATSTDPSALLDKEDEETASQSAWTTTSDTKKKKKDKKKSGSASASIFGEEEAPPIPPPPPAVPPNGVEDMLGTNTDDSAWPSFGTGKKGKKNKKIKEDLVKPEDPVAITDVTNEDTTAPGDTLLGDDWAGGWGTAVTKGNKKKNKDKQGSLAADLLNDSVDDKSSANAFNSTFDPIGGAFGAIGGTKTKGSKPDDGKKKKSDGWASSLQEENFWGDATDEAANHNSRNVDGIDGDLMDMVDNNDDGKNKNKKKNILAEDSQTNAEPDGMSASNDFGSWVTSSKKEKKSKKTKSIVGNSEIPPPPPPPPPAPNVDDSKYDWGSADFFDDFGSTKNKLDADDKEKDKKKAKDAGKSKRSKKDVEADIKVVQPDAVDETGKDEFSSLLEFGKNGKKKDSKRNNPVEVVDDGDAAFTVQPDAIETKSAIEEDFDFTGFSSTKKGKKGKKTKESTPPLPTAPMPPGDTGTFEPELPPTDEQPNPEPDSLWGLTTSKKDKKKKNSKAIEDADSGKKSYKDLKNEKEEDLFKEEPKERAGIEDPPIKSKKSSMWDTKDEEASTVKSTAPKTKKEKEKEKKEKEKKEKREKEKEELAKVKKEAEEAEEALKAENSRKGDPNEIVDIVDESTTKEKKKKKSKKEAVEIVEDIEPKDAKKKEQKDLEGDPNEIIDLGADGIGKDAKNKKKKKKDEKISSKSSKKTDDDKISSKNDDEAFAVGDDEAAGEADAAGAKDGKKESPKPKKEEVKQSDGWSFWGLKSTAKKDKDKDASPKKELGAVTKNDDLATADGAKASDPAPPHESPAPSSPPISKSAKSKGSAKLAVADRIKAFQGDKTNSSSLETSSKAATANTPAADAADPFVDILETSSKPTSAAITSKKAVGSSKNKSSKKKEGKDAAASGSTADPAQEQPLIDIPDASTPVPGGFPEDAMDNQDNAGNSPTKDKERDKKKDRKSDKKTDKTMKKDVKLSRSAKMENSADKSPGINAELSDNDAEVKPKKTSSKESKKSKEPKEPKEPRSKKEAAPVEDDAKMLPTPPPEPKPVKKERARVVRDQNSWGFWGAAPKGESKRRVVKDETAGMDEQTPAPRISRSKSARKASDRDPEKSPQSSGSETRPVKVESKPKTSRGMSLSNMFGAPPPPSRSKSHRHSTATPKSRSRRPSMDDYGKLPTPPPDSRDELRVSAKAAKVMGIGGKTSSSKRQSAKGKSRAVPDPYAIDDDDDIVMVDAADTGMQDSAMPPAEPETSTKRFSSKSKSKGVSRGDKLMSSSTEDAVLVDPVGLPSGNNADEMDIPSPQRSLKRSSAKRTPTSTKDVAGGFMSLFGGFRKKERERRLSDEDEDSSGRRKRTSGGQGSGTGDEEARRSKGDRRNRHRSHKTNDADGNITDGARRSTDAEDVDARRAQRRARRAEREAAGDMTETDNRAARRKDKERDRDRAAYEAKKARAAEVREKRVRQEEEYEARRAEERRARRAARDAEAREADARDAERRARRRERLKERETVTAAGGAGEVTATEERPRSKPSDHDRRRSHNDKTRATADGDQARRLRHEERRLKRSSTAAGAPEKLTRRRTAPIEDYFDPRNSRNNRRKTSDNSSGEKVGRPYLPTGKDKTSSWVNSVNASPPLPPPVEGTVLDPPPNRGAPADLDDEDAAKRERRARRRAEREKERRRDEKVRQSRSSDGSGGPPPDRLSRRKTYHAPPPMDKRGSWLQKIRGF